EHGGGLVYELAWAGQGRQGERFLVGLTDPAALPGHADDADRSGRNGARSGPGRGPVGGWSAPGRDAPDDLDPQAERPDPGHRGHRGARSR
ncbi:MAG: hypothetical protein ACRDYV_14295, partial [Acidimicrobiia bacterium]